MLEREWSVRGRSLLFFFVPMQIPQNVDINIANNIDNNKPVANCDQLQNDEVVVTTPVESRIMSIRGKQIMIDRDLAELYVAFF